MNDTLLDEKGFDNWAKEYDNSVMRNKYSYPFDRYYEGLYKIYEEISSESVILDIGFGTATLTKRLYDKGCKIYGIDFSKEMIKIAQEKMPNATLYQQDFNNGIPNELLNTKYDYIISTYAIHHLKDDKKIEFLNNLKTLLNNNGKIIILDIAFVNNSDLEKCKNNNIDDWDSSEYYIVWDNLKGKLENFKFKEFSSCSGFLEYNSNSITNEYKISYDKNINKKFD